MTKENPLSRKLATLTAKDAFTGDALHLGPSGTPEVMDQVLRAIDDTMLLRDVVFAVGDSNVTLRISGKRIVAVAGASKDLRAPEGLIDTSLNADTADALRQTAALLERLIAKPGMLTLLRRPAESAAKQSGSGVGIRTLQECWIAVQAMPQLTPLENFRASCKPHAEAIIMMRNGEVETHWGEQPRVDLLVEIVGGEWSDFVTKHAPFVPSDTGPLIRIIAGLGGSEGAVVISKIEEKQCLALVSEDGVAPVAAAWAQTVMTV